MTESEEKKRKERKGKERKGKERKGEERRGKERTEIKCLKRKEMRVEIQCAQFKLI